MTIASTARKAGPLLGNGSATAFPFAFKVFSAADIQVAIADSAGVETVLEEGTHYTVSLNANQETSPGGSVAYPVSGSPLPVGSVLSIIGDLDYDQPLDLPSGGNFSPLALENQLDRATIQIQQLKEQVDRSAKLPQTSNETPDALVFNITRLGDSADNIDAVAVNLAAVNTTAGSIANVDAVGSNIANVNTVAGISANVTTVAGVAADVTTVADNVTDITNFSDVYYGPSATGPTLRKDGSALQSGDLYFYTGSKRLRVFDGVAWVDGPINAGTITRDTFSGTGAQTTFTLSVDPVSENNAQVFIGGVYQQKSEYSVSGTTLTFSAAPVSGTDNIEVLSTTTLALGAAADLVLRANLAATGGSALVGFQQAGTGAVATNVQSKLREVVSVFDFMTPAQIADIQAGTYTLPITAAFQAAVTAVCGAGKTLFCPAGVYVFTPTAGKAISFPNSSFCLVGEGPTATAFSLSTNSTTDRIFDFTGCNGPAKLIEKISLNGKIGAAGTTSVGVYCDGTNGLVMRDVWFRATYEGARKLDTSSYVDLLDCVFEYCTTGINWDDAVSCSIQNPLFYRNVTDAYFTGDLDNLVASDWRCGNTNSYGVRFVGARNGKFGHLSFRQDFASYTPDLVRFEGVCSNIEIGLVSSVGFGRVLVAMASGATVTGCKVGLSGKGAIDAGVEIGSSSTGNVFHGVLDGLDYGAVDAAGSNIYQDLAIKNCTVAGVLQANCTDNTFSRVTFAGNAVDWITAGSVSTTWLDEVDTTMAGLTATRIGTRRSGIFGRTFYGTAAPSTLAYLQGDRVLNVTPVGGQPKAWVCTVAGTPGTWVSEGNL